MSAQHSGTQPPPPEQQSGRQLHDVPSAGKMPPEYRADPEQMERESAKMRDTKLQSNPEHPLEKIEAEKNKEVGLE